MGADEVIVNNGQNGNDAADYAPPEDANNRSFLILASLLTGTLLLLSLFTVGYLLLGRTAGPSPQIAEAHLPGSYRKPITQI